jgi:hypothetical protein
VSYNVGGIHVRAKPGLTPARVSAAVDAYFRKAGASRSDRGARKIPELAVEDTGKLAVAVLPARDGYVAIIDSERYTGSIALAEHLAAKLKTSVLHWTASGATNSGDATWFGGRPKNVRAPPEDVDHMEIVAYLGRLDLPFVLASFDTLEELPRATRIMGFRDVPFEAYDGELDEDEDENDGVASTTQIAAWRDEAITEGLAIWTRVASREKTGVERATRFAMEAPRFSVGQREGLLGLVDSLAEVDGARADAITRQVLDWSEAEPPPIGSVRTAPFWASAARQALLRDDLTGCELALARFAVFRPTILVGMYTALYEYPPEVLVDWLRRTSRNAELAAVIVAKDVLAKSPARVTAKQASALATTWRLLVGWMESVPRASLELDALADQADAAGAFGEIAAPWLAALERHVASRKKAR